MVRNCRLLINPTLRKRWTTLTKKRLRLVPFFIPRPSRYVDYVSLYFHFFCIFFPLYIFYIKLEDILMTLPKEMKRTKKRKKRSEGNNSTWGLDMRYDADKVSI